LQAEPQRRSLLLHCVPDVAGAGGRCWRDPAKSEQCFFYRSPSRRNNNPQLIVRDVEAATPEIIRNGLDGSGGRSCLPDAGLRDLAISLAFRMTLCERATAHVMLYYSAPTNASVSSACSRQRQAQRVQNGLLFQRSATPGSRTHLVACARSLRIKCFETTELY
jgi:hypothetical protein